ncbi:hypothetical protein KAW18_03650 [candidate division WOR-3 bacterium]|nr:hypothetical protein [candidate division WOR-3 bacterium]
MSKFVGLDLGTNMLITGISEDGGDSIFKNQRDCFYKIKPKTKVNKSSIKMSLDKRKVNYIEDEDGSFVIIGQDSLDIAIERNDVVERPMVKGVISPKEKASLPILKLIIKSLIGEGKEGDKCVFSIPSAPIDGNFDIIYHKEMLGLYLKQMGFETTPINEAFAVALSELIDSGLTGGIVTYGAGLCNMAIIHEGDPILQFSLQKAGDYVDEAVGKALDISPSLVQTEKEAGTDLYSPSTIIMKAVSVYYRSVLNYTIKTIAHELKVRKKELPLFREPMPIVLAGGLTLAKGFVQMFNEALKTTDFPIEIGKVMRAEDPLRATAKGALLAAMM